MQQGLVRVLNYTIGIARLAEMLIVFCVDLRGFYTGKSQSCKEECLPDKIPIEGDTIN